MGSLLLARTLSYHARCCTHCAPAVPLVVHAGARLLHDPVVTKFMCRVTRPSDLTRRSTIATRGQRDSVKTLVNQSHPQTLSRHQSSIATRGKAISVWTGLLPRHARVCPVAHEISIVRANKCVSWALLRALLRALLAYHMCCSARWCMPLHHSIATRGTLSRHKDENGQLPTLTSLHIQFLFPFKNTLN